MPVFISEVNKANSTKKKNEHGDICFLINYKFLCKISFKIIGFCFCSYIIYSRFKRFFGLNGFFYKIDFSLKIKLRAFFSLCFYVLLLAISM